MSFIAVESYRQAIRNNRLLVKVVMALAVLSLLLGLSIAVLLPLKSTEYQLYEFSASGQTFYRIGSADDLAVRRPALIRMAARQYVSYRERIDRLTEESRFASVLAMSSDEVAAEAQASYTAVNEALAGGTRQIVIELDYFLNNNPAYQIHHVEFKTIDRDQSGESTSHYWQAVLGYRFNEQQVRLDDLVQNPLGFEVVSYAITKRNVMAGAE